MVTSLVGVQVDGGEADQGFGDDAEVGFDGGARAGVAPVDAEVDRDVEDPGAFGVVHAQEEDVGPRAMGEVETDGSAFDQDGEEAVAPAALEEGRDEADRVFVGRADAEHPAVAPAASDGAADLVGQGLVADLLVGVRRARSR